MPTKLSVDLGQLGTTASSCPMESAKWSIDILGNCPVISKEYGEASSIYDFKTLDMALHFATNLLRHGVLGCYLERRYNSAGAREYTALRSENDIARRQPQFAPLEYYRELLILFGPASDYNCWLQSCERS